MSTALRLRQVWTITRLQLRRVFFSRRSFWVYLLALFPAFIFFLHGLHVTFMQRNWADKVTPASVLEAIRKGDSETEVLRRTGEPVSDRKFTLRRKDAEIEYRNMTFFDGQRRWFLRFKAGILERVNSKLLIDFQEDRGTFASVFHHFYLRLAIFFGCLGIFMNLFRGEMLDKTLHYWFLVPARREVLLIGQYLAGLIAAVAIFTAGAWICYATMLWPQDPAELSAFWRDLGPSHAFRYAAAAALACVGYGKRFSGCRTAAAQSNRTRDCDPALGGHQRYASRGTAEAERALLRAVCDSAPRPHRPGRPIVDPSADGTGRTALGCHGRPGTVGPDGSRAMDCVPHGPQARNRLRYRLSINRYL